jgi:DNA-binding beta-propeller fold protein YncE
MQNVTGITRRGLLAGAGTALGLASPSGADLAVVEKKGGRVGFYTAVGEKVGEVKVGAFPHEGFLTADARTLYVSDNGVLWMTEEGDGGNTISVVDTRTMKRTRTLDLGKYRRPHGLGFDARRGVLYSTTELPDGLVAVSVKSGSVLRHYDTKGVNPHMAAFHAASGTVWVSNSDSDSVGVLEPGTGRVEVIEGVARPQGGVFSHDGSVFYVTSSGGHFLGILSTAGWRMTGKIATRRGPGRVCLTPDGKTLVYNLAEDTGVAFADVATGKETGHVAFDDRPLSCTLSRDGKLAYAGLQETDRVAVVSVAERKIVRMLQLPKGSGPDPVYALR